MISALRPFKLGQDLENRAAHPYLEFAGVHPGLFPYFPAPVDARYHCTILHMFLLFTYLIIYSLVKCS